MKLDISGMAEDRIAIRAVRLPERVLSLFRKMGPRGPFTILLDVNALITTAPEIDYLQVTVDFNEYATEVTVRDDETGNLRKEKVYNVQIGQRGRSGNLVPIEHLEGPSRAYSYTNKEGAADVEATT